MLSLTEEEIQRSEKARAEAEATRRAAEEKLVAEAEARRKRDAERVRLQVAAPAAPAEPKRSGPTKEELDATAAKVRDCCLIESLQYTAVQIRCQSQPLHYKSVLRALLPKERL